MHEAGPFGPIQQGPSGVALLKQLFLAVMPSAKMCWHAYPHRPPSNVHTVPDVTGQRHVYTGCSLDLDSGGRGRGVLCLSTREGKKAFQPEHQTGLRQTWKREGLLPALATAEPELQHTQQQSQMSQASGCDDLSR